MERLSAPSGYKGPQPAVKPDLVGKLVKCSHVFHLHCLVAMYNNGNKVRDCSTPSSATSAELHGLSMAQRSSLAALEDSGLPPWLTLGSHPGSEFNFYLQQALGNC